ncbi:MAG: hypothetical protein JO182_27285 [Acidobacteriaceae bacterium]|nr:hypothetical protein [Acidobacteriaceae bacterium]MBV9038223.1 hypothetical protein [Acidobacteriaceae bacterium]MBV9307590.1 hypothetical protein [Acidobacteriaceae bacterium]
MKGKVTSLVLVGGAFAVGALTQDSSSSLLTNSRVLTALITTAWFGVMGIGLYFWVKHARQETPQDEANPTRAAQNLSLRQLATALGHNKAEFLTESVETDKEAVQGENTQKVSS